MPGRALRVSQDATETDGEYFQFEWTLRPDGVMSFARIRMRQTEEFEVLNGETTVTLDGTPRDRL